MNRRHSEKGMALVITLLMLAVVTFMAVVFLALSRSQELSEGARWKVMGVLLVLLALSFAFAVLLGLFMFVMLSMGWAGSNFAIVSLVLRGLVGAIVNVVWGAVLASLYVELVQWKEGGSVEALERVFV